MAQFAVAFAVSYLLTRLGQKSGPRQRDLRGFTADYDGYVARIYGPENRFDAGTIIWATPIIETKHKHKPKSDFLFGVAGALLPSVKTYTYSVSFAVLICGNPIARVKRMWLNKKLVFDVGVSGDTTFVRGDGKHKEFDTIRIYTGSMTQLPDPTMEADLGLGNVPAYLGLSYVVVDTLQLENFGNAVPGEIEFEVEEAASCTLRRVTTELAAASGIDTNTISTTSLVGDVRGLILDSGGSVADALSNLGQAYGFDVGDVAGGLRMVPRGRYPQTTITAAQMGGHDADDERPEPIRFSHQQEIGLPQEVAVSFFDPDRDYQPNVATTRRAAGSANANISVQSGLVLGSTQAQAMADRIMWTAWSARDTAFVLADDSRQDVGAMQVHAVATPTGFDTYRVLRRTRGANGVIEWQMEADRPQLYDLDLGGVPAPTPSTSVSLPQPINEPVFIEPPADLAGGNLQLWLAVSGGNGVLASGGSTYLGDPDWPGVSVYIASEDVDASYRLAGAVTTSAYMGVLTRPLEFTSGATPDVVDVLGVDLAMSLGVLQSVSTEDAAGGLINLAWVESPGGDGEYVTFRDQLSTQPYVYELTTLYRGLHGSLEVAHVEGASVVLIDDALLRMELPAAAVGQVQYFKFVQPMQTLEDVDAYAYTPTGAHFTALPPSDVDIDTSVVTQADGTQLSNIVVTWQPSLDPLLDHYDVELSTGGGVFFSIGSAGADASSISYTAALSATVYIARVRAVTTVQAQAPSPYASSAGTTSGTVTAAREAGFAFERDVSSIVVSKAVRSFDAPYAWVLPAGLADCQGTIVDSTTVTAAAPVAQTDFDLQVSGVSVGTMRFAAASLTATFIKATTSAPALGTITRLVAPADLNGMAGTLIGTIKGTR